MTKPKTWDTRVVFLERTQGWWWNAWYEPTATELYGFADSREQAAQAMYRAIADMGTPPLPPRPR